MHITLQKLSASYLIIIIITTRLTLASYLSRSLKVIGTDMDRSAIYDFLLTFHSKRVNVVSFWRKTAI